MDLHVVASVSSDLKALYKSVIIIIIIIIIGENQPLGSCRKVVWFTVQKMAQPDASEPHFAPNWADFAQNFMNGVTLRPVHAYRRWLGSAAICRSFSRKICFSDPPRVNAGFHPTVIRSSVARSNTQQISREKSKIYLSKLATWSVTTSWTFICDLTGWPKNAATFLSLTSLTRRNNFC